MFTLKPTSSASLVKKFDQVKKENRGNTGRRGTPDTTNTRLSSPAGGTAPSPNHSRPPDTNLLPTAAALESRLRVHYTERSATAAPLGRVP